MIPATVMRYSGAMSERSDVQIGTARQVRTYGGGYEKNVTSQTKRSKQE